MRNTNFLLLCFKNRTKNVGSLHKVKGSRTKIAIKVRIVYIIISLNDLSDRTKS